TDKKDTGLASPRDAREVRTPDRFIHLRGAEGHNLKKIDVAFPLDCLCVVTGVSGSGKSTLVHDTFYPAMRQQLGEKCDTTPLPFKTLDGDGLDEERAIASIEMIDQSPISRSPRSCPVTYVKAFDPIRKLFAQSADARARQLTPGHFSFNSGSGRCDACEGDGRMQIDMQFLADVSVQCPQCKGRRFKKETLAAQFRNRSVADVLEMTIADAYLFFRGHTSIQSRLKRLMDVGLDYVRLGQPVSTLSSGEGQRLKIAAFLAGARRKRTLFVMDEPTGGLHDSDVDKLLKCFDALLADGHSLIVVEHRARLIRAADHIIDLGPGASDEGGQVVVAGTLEQVRAEKNSRTGAVI
ncbi:MAG: excinuclease ABC subunit A, partial [Planctomycetota bacterium]